jgi:hypothetical protein
LKLSALFAKYLYQHKQLNLPGFGVFTIDPSVPVPEATDRNFHDFAQQIRFTQKTVLRPDEEFIEFIRLHTGKIRPLAESDLESFLSDGKILMNIGKPFYFEGIGSIQKNRQGGYEFIPGEPLIDRLEVPNQERAFEPDQHRRPTTEEGYQESGTVLRKVLIALAVIIGLAAVIWGGYVMYNRNSNPAPVTTDAPATTPDTISLLNQDTSSTSAFRDTSIDPAGSLPVQPVVGGTYKFIIERTGSKTRALRRYSQLKEYKLDIQMEVAPDSSQFKLYFRIPASPSDTARIKDSLMRMYSSARVLVEQ